MLPLSLRVGFVAEGRKSLFLLIIWLCRFHNLIQFCCGTFAPAGSLCNGRKDIVKIAFDRRVYFLRSAHAFAWVKVLYGSLALSETLATNSAKMFCMSSPLRLNRKADSSR